jgi:hypothetical protein
MLHNDGKICQQHQRSFIVPQNGQLAEVSEVGVNIVQILELLHIQLTVLKPSS